MTKEEILELFEDDFDLNNRDSSIEIQRFFKLAENLCKTNKKDFIPVINDWLESNDNPNMQIIALFVICNSKIYELRQEVQNLKTNIRQTRKTPFLEADLEVVDKTIAVLEQE